MSVVAAEGGKPQDGALYKSGHLFGSNEVVYWMALPIVPMGATVSATHRSERELLLTSTNVRRALSFAKHTTVIALDKGTNRMKLHVRYSHRVLLGLTCVSFLLAPNASCATELKKQTLEAWDAYTQMANSQMRERMQGSFLWVDEAPDRRQSVRAGKILVSPVGQHNPKPVPSGLIHHWMGAAFIPGVRLTEVLSVVRDYDHYKEFYKPTVVDSKSLSTAGDCDNYSMLLVNKETVASTAVDVQNEACYRELDERRCYSTANSTRVQEIRHYGRVDAQELPPDQGNGYIWHLYGLARFEERDGGVYVEAEAMALSRDIPFAFRWIVDPIVRRISKNSMLIFLNQLKEAVRSAPGKTR
jgi:hypothetical protein